MYNFTNQKEIVQIDKTFIVKLYCKLFILNSYLLLTFYLTDYRSCTADDFQCDNGQCIPLEYKCKKSEDERMGCVDKSHLTNCGMLILY